MRSMVGWTWTNYRYFRRRLFEICLSQVGVPQPFQTVLRVTQADDLPTKCPSYPHQPLIRDRWLGWWV